MSEPHIHKLTVVSSRDVSGQLAGRAPGYNDPRIMAYHPRHTFEVDLQCSICGARLRGTAKELGK